MVQKNNQGELDDNSNATSIPIPLDPLEKPEPNNSNIQTIESNNQDNKDQTIELNNQDNKDLNKQNILIIEQSDQDATNLINHDFQTHTPLSNIQINSISSTNS
ncbi:3198_t:CDS:2, partial [Racocetra persica]